MRCTGSSGRPTASHKASGASSFRRRTPKPSTTTTRMGLSSQSRPATSEANSRRSQPRNSAAPAQQSDRSDVAAETAPIVEDPATDAHFDVVIVGGGFGGFYAARALERAFHHDSLRRVLLVALENYFLFSPLLAEAASGTIEPRHAVIPLRSQLRSTSIVVGAIEAIDLSTRSLTVADRLRSE